MSPDLGQRTLELVNVPSVSRAEQEIAEYVAGAMPWAPAHRDAETLWYEAPRAGRPLVVLAGHLDTVPEQGNLPGRIEDGAVHGLGATDMKAGLAVMIELARWVAAEEPEVGVDLAFLFFPREELPSRFSALPAVFEQVAAVREAALAIVLEPTDNTIQLGCLGHIRAELVFEGVASHSARPWLGVNAIGVALEGLAPVLALEPRDVEIGGLTFREVLSVTRIEGGVADNVIPDRVGCTLSYRYAPDRTPEEAERELRRLVGAGRLENLENSAAARVAVDNPLVERLRKAGDYVFEPKQAWTPVAEFSAAGLDAVNLGPGATRYAHKRDEQVEIAELDRTFRALQRFVSA